MNKYYITTEETIYQTYIVWADSKPEAERKFQDGFMTFDGVDSIGEMIVDVTEEGCVVSSFFRSGGSSS